MINANCPGPLPTLVPIAPCFYFALHPALPIPPAPRLLSSPVHGHQSPRQVQQPPPAFAPSRSPKPYTAHRGSCSFSLTARSSPRTALLNRLPHRCVRSPAPLLPLLTSARVLQRTFKDVLCEYVISTSVESGLCKSTRASHGSSAFSPHADPFPPCPS